MRRVYIAGPITGVDDYRERFAVVETTLQQLSVEPVNPACAPEGLTYRRYIDRGLELLSGCDAICMLQGWHKSVGASLEKAYADAVGLPVIYAIIDEAGGVQIYGGAI